MTVPETIGKYKILGVVAVGGMGTVYKALHPKLKRQVILKKLTLRSGSASIRERFKREAQILLDLSSPYVVRMFDYFSEGRSDYIVLELVDGMSLDKLIKKQLVLPPQLALLIFQDACYALKHAHAKGIVHRDIKPGNILISRRAEVKLADFGIASSEKEGGDIKEEKGLLSKAQKMDNMNLTQSGTTLGTPAYMSPEQFDDSSSVDQRADIYSMGVMLYEMVTGSKPYSGDMAPETIAAIKKGRYVSPEKRNKKIPHTVSSLIKKMMKPNPKSRYQTIEPVLKKVRKYLSKYDSHAVRVSLAQAVLSPKPVKFPEYEEKKHYGAKITFILFLLLSLSASFYFLWKEGFFHATLLKKWYRPVELSLEVPATASSDADLPARAFFFFDDGKDIPEVNGSRRIFEVNDNDKKNKTISAKNITMTTKKVYLKDGNYRLKVAEGPYVWWKSFSVNGKELSMNLDFLKNAGRILKVNTRAFDAESGKEITSKCSFFIKKAGNFIPLESLEKDELVTGKVYRFLIKSPGYKDELFSLRLDWYQDELFINGSLKKE